MTRRTFFSCSVFITALVSVCRAFLANRLGDKKWVPLPVVAPEKNTLFSLDELVGITDRVVRLAIMNTAHPCLYYSYARCRVLRRAGHPVKINMGLHNLHGNEGAEGHCWISMEGQPLFEENDLHELYPDRMGERDDVVYWGRLKSGEGQNSLRLKRE